jgi:hypothetical protein
MIKNSKSLNAMSPSNSDRFKRKDGRYISLECFWITGYVQNMIVCRNELTGGAVQPGPAKKW